MLSDVVAHVNPDGQSLSDPHDASQYDGPLVGVSVAVEARVEVGISVGVLDGPVVFVGPTGVFVGFVPPPPPVGVAAAHPTTGSSPGDNPHDFAVVSVGVQNSFDFQHTHLFSQFIQGYPGGHVQLGLVSLVLLVTISTPIFPRRSLHI